MDKRAREGSQSRSTSSSIIALICMIVAGCNFYSSSFADAKIIELTVANINGDVILLSDLDNKVRRLNRVRGNQLKISATRKEALDTIIRENLVERYAAEIGISVSDEDLNSSIEQIIASEGKSKKEFIKSLKDSNLDFTEFQDQIRYNMLTNRVFGFEIKRPVISDEKAKEYYLANRDKFKSKRKIQFSHIITVLPKDGDESSSKRAQERIREALAELESGAKFADVASKYSEDKSALTGGLVGWIEE
ncbi:MAG: SurA N-terminal domain-containing protein, partial [Nitrospinota bacterium]